MVHFVDIGGIDGHHCLSFFLQDIDQGLNLVLYLFQVFI